MLLIVAPTEAAAQSTTDLTVRAAINAGISLTVTGEVNFGSLNTNPMKRQIDPRAPTPGMSAGRVDVGAEAGTTVAVSYSPVRLNHVETGGGVYLDFTPAISADAAGNQAASVLLMGSGATITINSAGTQTVWVGGDLVVQAGQSVGTYSGTMTLTLSYVGS